ncbi:MAG: chemotaxis-specific protein-glutamate methyltransferase CheB [Bacteroidales bacterium]|nr:chemotaxis-specific protein-glutamate methyltransferase CheB [Bacteroidales bacterium]MCF8338726.1 chemotaxis-specific protein-glutamate methyltransferase CheB [Bacteroidales bacterium]
MKEQRKLLIVDDSRYMREYLADLFSADGRFKLLTPATDPYQAAKIIGQEAPDVIALDIEMPRMNGLTFLKKIMRQHPIPVVIITQLDVNQIQMSLEALNAGAIDVVAKKDINPENESGKQDLLNKMWAAANSRINRLYPEKQPVHQQERKSIHPRGEANSDTIVMIGASSGGTAIISTILNKLPSEIPGTIIVQHIPEHMSYLFAKQLNAKTPFYVKEAENGDRVLKNKVLVAPGNHHIELQKDKQGYYCRITHGPPINHVRPSVDKLFFSALPFETQKMYAFLLSGMGRDGAQGLLKLRQKGTYTVAQDEGSSVIFGMPKVAIDLGAAKAIMNTDEIIALFKSVRAG